VLVVDLALNDEDDTTLLALRLHPESLSGM
jgi:hypothetical protein